MGNRMEKRNEPFIVQRADPYVYRHTNGIYYFTASVPAYDKVVLRCSKTLQGLKEAEEKTIWVKHEKGIMSTHIWAPELHYLNGVWYIYFAAGDVDDVWEIRPYVLECTGDDPMNDLWVEKGKMQTIKEDETSFTGFSLDATIFENKGVHYFVWAEKPREAEPPISNLYIAPLENPVKLAEKPMLLTTPEYNWEKVDFLVNEGPAVIKRDGIIYLTYSASGTGACYCMGMLSIPENADMMDRKAWEKGNAPVFKTDEEKGVYGPGHNSFTKSEDGKDICIFHARTYEEIEGNPLYDPNRHTMIMEVKWDETNRPVFSLE